MKYSVDNCNLDYNSSSILDVTTSTFQKKIITAKLYAFKNNSFHTKLKIIDKKLSSFYSVFFVESYVFCFNVSILYYLPNNFILLNVLILSFNC